MSASFSFRKAKALAGFTLVEVLVAMFVMAIMAAMAWRGIDGIVRTRNATQSDLERTLRLNTVIAQWDQDLTSVQDTLAVQMPIQCDGTSVRMVRRTPNGMQVVAWSMRPDDTGYTWVRWAGPSVTTVGQLTQSWQKSQQLEGDEEGSLKTLSGLSGWKVYFYQGNAWANCQSTGDVIAGTNNHIAAPKGVRAILSFSGSTGISGDLTRDTIMVH